MKSGFRTEQRIRCLKVIDSFAIMTEAIKAEKREKHST